MSTYFPKTELPPFPVVPTGRYRAKLTGFEMIPSKYKEGEQAIRWKFDLGTVETNTGEMEPVELTRTTSTTVSNTPTYGKTNLWKLAEACGQDPSNGVDADAMIGAVVFLEIVEKDRDDGKGTFSSIESFRPAPAKAATNGHAKAHARQAAPADDHDADPF